MKNTYHKGDIVLINLGSPPEEIKGHEQAYERPCVVIKSFENLGLMVVVPCTTKKPKYNLYSIVELSKGKGGLNSNSYVLCHQIRCISFDRVIDKWGRLERFDILKIHSVLIDMLEL